MRRAVEPALPAVSAIRYARENRRPGTEPLGGRRTSIDDPYFHIVMDGGRSGFISAVILSNATTNVDPGTAAECKKKGSPKLGMTAAQVKASCWGAPKYVNAKVRKTGKYEQYVYGDGKFVQIRDGIVTSVSVKGRGHIPDELKR